MNFHDRTWIKTLYFYLPQSFNLLFIQLTHSVTVKFLKCVSSIKRDLALRVMTVFTCMLSPPALPSLPMPSLLRPKLRKIRELQWMVISTLFTRAESEPGDFSRGRWLLAIWIRSRKHGNNKRTVIKTRARRVLYFTFILSYYYYYITFFGFSTGYFAFFGLFTGYLLSLSTWRCSPHEHKS